MGKHLEAETGDEPDLVQAPAEVVEGVEERLGKEPHEDHGHEGDGPHGKNQQIGDVRVGRVAPEHEGRVD